MFSTWKMADKGKYMCSNLRHEIIKFEKNK